MRIEEITAESLSKVEPTELYSLRLRFVQLWGKHFEGNARQQVGTLQRADLLARYKTLAAEMKTRSLATAKPSAIDEALFRKALLGVDCSCLPALTVVPDYVSLAGSFAKNPAAAEDADLVIRDAEITRDEGAELLLTRALKPELAKALHFIYSPRGPHSISIPLFDLVLQPKAKTARTAVETVRLAKALSPADQQALDLENLLIRENKKKPETQKPHRFKPAAWTAGNGHPRCLLCGDEEPVGGVCNMPHDWYNRQEWDDEKAWTEERRKLREQGMIKAADDTYYQGLDTWDADLLQDNAAVMAQLVEGSVLDLGCGSGRLLKLLAAKGRTVQGVEKNTTALAWTKSRGLDVLHHDLEAGALPWPDASWDNVVAVHVLEHLEHPDFLIKEASRIARSRVLFLVPLGARKDPTHRQQYNTQDDLAKCLPADDGWLITSLAPQNTALAVFDKLAKAKELKPLQHFTPLKMAEGYAMGEQYDIETMWKEWAQAYVDRGIKLAVQKKFNGWRTVLELDGAGRTLVFFEDTQKDRSRQFPDLSKELGTLKRSVIFDAELEAVSNAGQAIPRKDLAYWGGNERVPLAFETPAGVHARYQCHVFDVLHYDGQDLHPLPYQERRRVLEKIFGQFDFKIMKLTPEIIVSDKTGFMQAVKKASALPGSEGAVVKTTTGDYPLTGQSPTWAKIKTIVEVKVQVLERVPVKGSSTTWNYVVGYAGPDGKVVELGKTYNTQVKAEPGAILTISVQEVIPEMKDGALAGVGVVVPGVRDVDLSRKQPETAAEMVTRGWKAGILQATEETLQQLRATGTLKKSAGVVEKAEEGAAGPGGNVDFEAGDKGNGVAQLHIMGIEEDKVQALREDGQRVTLASGDVQKLQQTLLALIGEQGAHVDLRLQQKGKDYWEGGEIMLGNISGLSKLRGLQQNEKLRFAWKQSRAGEQPAAVVRGPLNWLDIGKRKVEVFNPGEAGATVNLWGAIVNLDTFGWEIYLADEHAKKFHITGGRLLAGNWLMAYVPVGERERVWMVNRLAADDHEVKKFFRMEFMKAEGQQRRQQIVGGVVYAPDRTDAHGEEATAADIEKGMYSFMEKSRRFKVNHQGREYSFPILECFQPETDTMKGGKLVPAGSWFLTVKVTDAEIWRQIEAGELTGFSMAGHARREPIA